MATAPTRRQFASIANRNIGPQFIQQTAVPLTAGVVQRFNLVGGLPIDKPIERVLVVVKFRVVIGTADYTTVAAEAPQSIVQNILLRGTHRDFQQLAVFDMSGASAFAYPALFKRRATYCTINGVLQNDPSTPFAQTASNFGVQGTFDVEIHYEVPTAPVFGPSSRAATLPFMLQPLDWNDSLQLQITMGDKTAFGTPAGGTTVTFTAFGSGAGTPTVDVYTNQTLLGPLQDKINGLVVVLNEVPATGAVTAITKNVNLYNLQKRTTSNIFVKSGTILAGTTGGVEAFQTVVDTILDRTSIKSANKALRDTNNNNVARAYIAKMFDANAIGGYFPFTFVESGNPLTSLQGDRILAGAQFFVSTDVLTAGATQAVRITQEMIYQR